MSSWMNNLRNFGRSQQPPRNPNQPPSRTNTDSPSSQSPSSAFPPSVPPQSFQASTMSANEQAHQSNQGKKKVPFFFREEYAGFMVKGNFMTLAAKPQNVEEGEWIAHQVVEQGRLLAGMMKIFQTEDRAGGHSLCNEKSCPSMTAGNTTYTWVDTNRNPINLPAATYMKHIQTWIAGKVQDEIVFPTATFSQAPPLPTPQQVASDPNFWLGKSSGFPQRYENECKNMYKQMFRCYAHLYWSHWLQLHELNVERNLNTCFMHFVNVGRIFGLLTDKDTEPMQPLIDIWIRKGDLPAPASTTAQPAQSTQQPQQSTATQASAAAAAPAPAPAPASAPAAAAASSSTSTSNARPSSAS